jgi:hypothetical protein
MLYQTVFYVVCLKSRSNHKNKHPKKKFQKYFNYFIMLLKLKKKLYYPQTIQQYPTGKD